MDYSQLGHILQEIKMLVASLCKGSFSCVSRFGNSVLHSLAKFAKSIFDNVIWIEDPPPPTLEVLFFDVNESFVLLKKNLNIEIFMHI